MLKVEQLSKQLGDFFIRDISFEVDEGEYFVLLGASGVGKTVLLETITGLMSIDSGSIYCNGTEVTYKQIQKRGIGLVYQDQALFPHLSVRRNIAYGLKCHKRSRTKIDAIVEKIAREVEIDKLLDRKPDTLSGGEAQRVALARALAVQPRCLLLDEPISSLDVSARGSMRALLRSINRNHGITMIHVTHDYEEAIALATRIGIMEHGRVVQIGSPREIFQHPKSEFVANFIGIKNFFSGELKKHSGKTDTCAEFIANGLSLSLASDVEPGFGNVIIRSEDVTIAVQQSSSSARNVFKGTITDICPVRLGIEVIVDIGLEIAALVTQESTEKLDLTCGKEVYVSVKATAIRFLAL